MTRGLLLFLACMIVIAAPAKFAEAQLPILVALDKLGGAAVQGADAFAKFADSIDKVVGVVTKVHDTLVARAAKKRTKDLYRRLVWLGVEKRGIYNDIRVYLKYPSSATWSDVATRIPLATNEVVALLEKLKKENSDFVVAVPFVYRDLVQGLTTKQRLLDEFGKLSRPTSSAEINSLNRLNIAFDEEIVSIERASDALAKYVAARYSDVPE